MQALSLKQNKNRHGNQPTPQTLPKLLPTRSLITFNLKPYTPNSKLKLNPKTPQPHRRGKRDPTPYQHGGGGHPGPWGSGGGGGRGALTIYACLSGLASCPARSQHGRVALENNDSSDMHRVNLDVPSKSISAKEDPHEEMQQFLGLSGVGDCLGV